LQQNDTSGNAYYCPGIEPAGDAGSPSVIGANTLHTLLTVFDRHNRRVGFAPGQGCASLSEVARSAQATPPPSSLPAPRYRHRARCASGTPAGG